MNMFQPQSAAMAISPAMFAVFPDCTLPMTSPLTASPGFVLPLSLLRIPMVDLSISATDSGLKCFSSASLCL